MPVPGVVAVAGPEDEKVRLCVPHMHTQTHTTETEKNNNNWSWKRMCAIKGLLHRPRHQSGGAVMGHHEISLPIFIKGSSNGLI